MDDGQKIEYVDSSPIMLGLVQPPKRAENLELEFGWLTVGKSIKIPFDFATETALRVRVSRENAKNNGCHYRIIRHGTPINCYEIGRIPTPDGSLPAPDSELPPVPEPKPAPTVEPRIFPKPQEDE